jgi:hypothetical protein
VLAADEALVLLALQITHVCIEGDKMPASGGTGGRNARVVRFCNTDDARVACLTRLW